MIEACDAPCILIRVVITKKKVISKKMSPGPVFRHEKKRTSENVRVSAIVKNEWVIMYYILLRILHDVSMWFAQGDQLIASVT